MKTFASLFSGGGGADYGAYLAQLQPIWGIEIDSAVAEVYTANLGYQPIIKSVADVNPRRLERPDVLWASPPCQEWSIARSKSLSPRDDARIGYAVIPFLEILQPSVFILENVEAYRKARVFHAIVDVLHQLGYWTSWSVLNAADWGVPQTRRRLILRAVKDGFVPPLPAKQNWVGWYEALADLIPTLPAAEFAPWQLERMPGLVTTSLVDGRNTIRSCTIRNFNEPSSTVTAHWLHRPCVTPKAWIKEGQVLAMTPCALARFQTFPDSYQLPESKTLASRVVGNAVPPLFAQRLLESMSQIFE